MWGQMEPTSKNLENSVNPLRWPNVMLIVQDGQQYDQVEGHTYLVVFGFHCKCLFGIVES